MGQGPLDRTAPKMYVGGEWLPSVAGDHLANENPATEEPLVGAPAATATDVERAVDAALEAAPSWARTSWHVRAQAIAELAERVRDSADELVALDVEDAGLPTSSARNDLQLAIGMARYFSGIGGESKGSSIPVDAETTSWTEREPYGVVGRIIPFNHPLMFAINKIAAPLMAGNAVVLKPSEHTSLSALAMARLTEGLLPPGVLNVVTGTGPEAGSALVDDPRIPRIAFTGGVSTGRDILTRAAAHLKAVTLELGGKNPMVVFPDVDPGAAADAAIQGMNLVRTMGQSCMSMSRILVHESMAGPFVEALAEGLEKLRVGDPRREDTDMGPLAHRGHYNRVMGYIEAGKADGARLVTGGGRPTSLQRGFFVEPTLFVEVQPDMAIAQEEIFGPVLSVLTWRDYDEMISMANGVAFGLTAAVWTRDVGLAHRTARSIQAGLVWINGAGKKVPGIPFGGIKASGIGKEDALEELLAYTRVKSYVLALDTPPPS